MTRAFRRDRKGISPVIATIIIVAVAIVMSIAVAYWLMGLGTAFTRYEKLEFISAYPIRDDDHYNITMVVKSTGSAPATVTKFFFNGVPDSVVNATNNGNLTIIYDGDSFTIDSTTVPVNPGETKTFLIRIPYDATIGAGHATSGVTLEIMIQTAAGYQYSKAIILP